MATDTEIIVYALSLRKERRLRIAIDGHTKGRLVGTKRDDNPSPHSQWQKLCEEHEAARDAYHLQSFEAQGARATAAPWLIGYSFGARMAPLRNFHVWSA
jgi:hypothetical protein